MRQQDFFSKIEFKKKKTKKINRKKEKNKMNWIKMEMLFENEIRETIKAIWTTSN